MSLAMKSTELQKAIDALVAEFGPHQAMAALIDNKAMQEQILQQPNVAWGFQYEWLDGKIKMRQNWSVLIMPSVMIYGEGPNQRPTG